MDIPSITAFLGKTPQRYELDPSLQIESFPRDTEVKSSKTRASDNDSNVIQRLNRTEDRKNIEAASHKITLAKAHREAARHAEAATGRYLNAKA